MTTPTTPMKQDENLKTKASDMASGFGERAKNAAETATEKAREAAGTVTDKAKEAASTLGKKAENTVHAVGSGMESLAGTIRDKMPEKGPLGAATSSVANSLEAGGHYLREEGLKGMADDVTNLIRRNPIPALLIGITAGFLLARATTRS